MSGIVTATLFSRLTLRAPGLTSTSSQLNFRKPIDLGLQH